MRPFVKLSTELLTIAEARRNKIRSEAIVINKMLLESCATATIVVCRAVSSDRYKSTSHCRQSNLCRPTSIGLLSSQRSEGNRPS